MTGRIVPADLFDHITDQYSAYIEPAQPEYENLPSADAIYQVQPGDSLWEISRKFHGLSIADLKELNNLEGNTIRPGQQLKLAE